MGFFNNTSFAEDELARKVKIYSGDKLLCTEDFINYGKIIVDDSCTKVIFSDTIISLESVDVCITYSGKNTHYACSIEITQDFRNMLEISGMSCTLRGNRIQEAKICYCPKKTRTRKEMVDQELHAYIPVNLKVYDGYYAHIILEEDSSITLSTAHRYASNKIYLNVKNCIVKFIADNYITEVDKMLKMNTDYVCSINAPFALESTEEISLGEHLGNVGDKVSFNVNKIFYKGSSDLGIYLEFTDSKNNYIQWNPSPDNKAIKLMSDIIVSSELHTCFDGTIYNDDYSLYDYFIENKLKNIKIEGTIKKLSGGKRGRCVTTLSWVKIYIDGMILKDYIEYIQSNKLNQV